MGRRPLAPSRHVGTLVAVGGLTILALALRLATVGQSLYGDEVFTYSIVTREDPLGILRTLQDSAITPPLHYMLAWVSVKLGDPTVTVRLPSVVFGTATVPLVYLLGTRTVGRPAGLVGAALMALSPFAVFYSTEARNYGTLIFLVALSTLLLLHALQTARTRWWVAFAVTSAAVLYCHYTGVFVIAAQGLWALLAHRDRARPLVAAYFGIALLYLPWLSSFLNQRSTGGVNALEHFAPFTLSNVAESTARLLPGHPFLALGDLPGPVALTLLGAGGVAVLVGLLRRREPIAPWPSPRLVLVLLLAVATPAGALFYSLGSSSIYASRNLIASLPAICLAAGALLSALDRRTRIVAVSIVIAAFAVAAIRSLESAYRRPPVNQAAEYINNRAPAGAVAVQLNPLRFPVAYPLLRAYLDRPITVVEAGERQERVWERLARRDRVYVMASQPWALLGAPDPPAVEPLLRHEWSVTWKGFGDVSVFVYRPGRRGSTLAPDS